MMLHPYEWPNHVKNLLMVVVKRTALDAADAKKQDSDVLNCVNSVLDAQISIKVTINPLQLFLEKHQFFNKNNQ